MKQIRTITSTEMRGINRTAILEIIRREGPTSRTAIAEKLNVSLPTVMRIVDDLVKEKLVVGIDEKQWSGGRKCALIKLNATEHLTIGLDLGGTKFYGAVTDLGGDLLCEETMSHHGTKGEASYNLLVELIEKLLQQAKGTGRHIMGIGVGVPGVTFHDRGIVEWAPSLEWRNFPLGERLKKHFNIATIVDNDVNLSALGEVWFGVGREANNLVLINIGTGIGAGLVIDGALYRGTHEMAGEIGYLLPGREYLNRDYPGFGALELLAAGTGIASRGRDALVRRNGLNHSDSLTAENVFEAHRRGEKWAGKIIEDTIDYLSIAIAAVITFFDPDVVALGGGVAQSGDLLIGPITKRLTGKIPHVPPIIASSLGTRAAVLGAMINLLHNISDFYIVRKLS